jgi:hypothetical protein
MNPKQKNKPWKIPASIPFRRPVKGNKGMGVLSPRIMIRLRDRINMPPSIQMMKAGMAWYRAIMIPPARGKRTRINGAFLNVLSNIVGYWNSCHL